MTKELLTKQELERALSVLIKGSQKEIKEAKRQIEKLWNKDSKSFQKAAPVALGYLNQFDKIERSANQVAFASGLNLFFLTLGDEHFEALKNFVLKVIQHSDGHVREAVRKTANWLYVSLSSRLHPFVYPSDKELMPKQHAEQQKAAEQYRNYIKEIEDLIEKYDDESEESIEYIDEMKPSVHKSLQILWSEVTRGNFSDVLHIPPPEIIAKRKEIEKELVEMLKETKSDFGLDDIKKIIYNEDGQDSLTDIIAMFDAGQGAAELQNVLELVNDAWNYFPHKIIGGLSPAEKLLEYHLSRN